MITITAGAVLTIVAKVNEHFTKTQETRNRMSDTNTVVAYAILNRLKAIQTEISTAMTQNIPVHAQAFNNGGIWHLVRRVKNLQVCEWTVDILDSKKLSSDFQSC